MYSYMTCTSVYVHYIMYMKCIIMRRVSLLVQMLSRTMSMRSKWDDTASSEEEELSEKRSKDSKKTLPK